MDNNIIKKEIKIGSKVYANELSMFEGLEGEVIDIKDGANKDTDNPGRDVYVSFYEPINDGIKLAIEKKASELYGSEKEFEDIAIDMVIMADDMIDLVLEEDDFINN